MKVFFQENGGVIAVIATVVACSWWVQSSIADIEVNQSRIQVEQAEKFLQQQKQFSDSVERQQKQFSEVLQKIGQVDANSRLRDKDLELLVKADK